MRPSSIELFEKFYLGAIAFSLVGFAMGVRQSRIAAQSGEANAVAMHPGFVAIAIAVSLAISLLLWYFVARRPSTVAKWIIVVLVAVGFASELNSLANPLVPQDLMMIVGLVANSLQVFAVWMLFQQDAVAWLDGKAPTDPSACD